MIARYVLSDIAARCVVWLPVLWGASYFLDLDQLRFVCGMALGSLTAGSMSEYFWRKKIEDAK